MALPFYNQGDQDIYAGGDHFIPQEQYRLNYTPSQSLASTIGNTGGVTGAQAANPYIWPPQGGGGGGGFSNTNKYGLDMSTMKTISSGKYAEKGGPGNMYGGDYVKTDRKIAQDEHGNWKDVDTNQNPYHANIGFKGMIGTVMDKVMGKKNIPGVPDDGSWTGAEWDEEFDPTIAGKKLNTIQRWKAKKEFVAQQEKAAADKVIADQAIAGAGAAGQRRPGKGGSHMSRSVDQGGLGITSQQAQDVSDANAAAGMSGWGLAQGGRIGMAKGKIPIPRAKTKMGFLDKLFMGIGGLSPYFGKARLHQSMSRATESGKAARAAQRANMIAKYGKGAMRVGRFAGLMNPWTAAPIALLAGAQYGVGKAFDPYRDETGKIGAEGHAQLASAARAREALMAQRNAARQNRRDGGLAGIL